MQSTYEKRLSWLDRPLLTSFTLSVTTIAFVGIMLLAVFTRFYHLEDRVMSHDENSHVYYSWLFYKGRGYSHDPVTHGPLQFHLVALSYFLFGDNDFTARIPAALFSIATIAFLWYYRRYLGRAGALVAAALMLISPFMLFYGRYVRNEAFVAFFGVVTIWAILRYIETGKARFLYLLTAITALHFTTKETAFIYTAQALIFLAFYLVYRLSQQVWRDPSRRNNFLIALMVALLFVAGAGGAYLWGHGAQAISAEETAAPAVPGQELTQAAQGGASFALPLILLGVAVLALLVALYFLIDGYGWQALRNERSFGIIVVLFTMVLPMLAPFPASALGFNARNYSDPQTITVVAILIAVLVGIAVAIGMSWNWRLWLINAAIFYAIFTVFYTTLFTNGIGFITGLVGSLAYWLEQQGVNRGSQPLYYYALIQIPVYEFLPALGSLLALFLVVFRKKPVEVTAEAQETQAVHESETRSSLTVEEAEAERIESPPTLALIGYWVVTSLLAYSIAGEKMPWLTVHITMPMILLSGWSIGYLIERTDWSAFRNRRGWLVLILLPIFMISLAAAMGSLLGINRPFQGKTLDELRATSTFVTSLLVAVGSGVGLAYLIRPWRTGQFVRVATLFVFAILGVLTVRTAVRAAYINYDNAKEYLVYAHSAPGVKEALAQIKEISRRTHDGLSIPVAYDNETSYPYWWYLRNFSQTRPYGENPTRSLRDVPIILVGDNNYGKIEPVVAQNYYQFDYIRLWWPSQDYFDLTWERIRNAIVNPEMRAAVFQIWFNRDYTLFGELTNKDFSLENWSPADRMRLYIRKDIVAELWNYGTLPTQQEIVADPFDGKEADLQADRMIGNPGSEPGQFLNPRGIAVAGDGSLYVADTKNNRIQHLAADGSVLQTWGSYADVAKGEAPGGTFNEPWGIALGPDGSVYVADVWNHRIQKFTPQGEFVTMWGYFGQAETPNAFWGPRDVAVDDQGRLFVTDTGNKRVVVFDGDGNYITQFGQTGMALGDFDEPVGIALGPDGSIYIADTWNQRIQVFAETDTNVFTAQRAWDVMAWYGQSQDNKPYLAVDQQGHVFATDPEGYRVLEFTSEGDAVRFWGDFGTELNRFGLAGAVAVDGEGGVWVTDTGNSRLMHFTLP
ncbi:MAG: TIGR03663 family protein [Anaerolineales bacterium]